VVKLILQFIIEGYGYYNMKFKGHYQFKNYLYNQTLKSFSFRRKFKNSIYIHNYYFIRYLLLFGRNYLIEAPKKSFLVIVYETSK
jgi:hypothetical protein